MNSKIKMVIAAALLLGASAAHSQDLELVFAGDATRDDVVEPFNVVANISDSAYSVLAYPSGGCGMDLWAYGVNVDSIYEEIGAKQVRVRTPTGTVTAGLAAGCSAIRSTFYDGPLALSVLTLFPSALSAANPMTGNALNAVYLSPADGIDSSGGSLGEGWTVKSEQLIYAAVVPEPDVLGLWALGLVATVIAHQRRRQS
jgi:hypothetical protein